jgi:hypothetical protein
MIDITTREKFQELISQARREGKDLAELADRSGILLTEQRLKDIQADVIGDLADMLETTSAYQWADEHKHLVPEDIRVGIAERFRKLEQAARRVGWRKG